MTDSIFHHPEHLHIELTNLCNASCPSCPRFFQNSSLINPGLKLNSWSLQDFKNRLPIDFLKNITHINFCGNHGDPVACKELEDILEYLHEINMPIVEVHSNVGAKTIKTWDRIGQIFAENTDWLMIFSVDGLEDTNHLYRRNIKWFKVEQNIRAFTKHGGTSDWDFLVFKHNEHQVEEARLLSKEWGITNFVPKIAANTDRGTSLKPMPANNNEGTTDYWIHAPANPIYRNADLDGSYLNEDLNFKPEHYTNKFKDTIPAKIIDYTEKDPEWDKRKIVPKCQKNFVGQGTSTVYIDANGTVIPCCWVGIELPVIEEAKMDGHVYNYATKQLMEKFEEYGGLDKLSLNKYSITEILHSGFLQNMFENTWDKTTAEGKMAVCSDFCGGTNVVDQIYTAPGVENERYKTPQEQWRKRKNERTK